MDDKILKLLKIVSNWFLGLSLISAVASMVSYFYFNPTLSKEFVFGWFIFYYIHYSLDIMFEDDEKNRPI